MKYTRAFRLSIYRKMRKYIKENLVLYNYLCIILKYELKGKYDVKDFPELLEIKALSGWWGRAAKSLITHNEIRLEALNKVIEDLTKSRTKKSINN